MLCVASEALLPLRLRDDAINVTDCVDMLLVESELDSEGCKDSTTVDRERNAAPVDGKSENDDDESINV